MRYAVNLPNGGPWGDARTLGGLARLAEESGWDGVFLEDYIIWQGRQDLPTTDPWIALAAMAMQTQRVRLGTMVTALPRRRPWKVARETVSLDHLSSGRMILGVGIGDTTVYVDDPSISNFGEVTDTKTRGRMLDEALELLVGLWSGEPFSYVGEFYRVNHVALLPRPVQKPRIPIWIGGGYPLKGPTQRALRWDGSCMYRQPQGTSSGAWSPGEVGALRSRAMSARGGEMPFDIALGGDVRGDDWDKERALIKSLADAGATWWIEYVPPRVGDLNAARACIARGPLRVD